MHIRFAMFVVVMIAAASWVTGCASQSRQKMGHHGFSPSGSVEENREAAADMIAAAEGNLAPVYAPLAAQIVADFQTSAAVRDR